MNLEDVQIRSWDERRHLLILGDAAAAVDCCSRHFTSICQQAIEKHGSARIALAGGSTPKAIYERLVQQPYVDKIAWEKVHLFWGDERNVAPTDPQSNYRMAMDAGFGSVPIPTNQIHRMWGEDPIVEHAEAYDALLRKHLAIRPLDLVLLGMGEDGHTASLFPQTDALHVEDRLAIAYYVSQKNSWRMTLTFPALNSARQIAICVIGDSKKEALGQVLQSETCVERYPVQKIGTRENPALWIVDGAAAEHLPSPSSQ